MGTLSENLSLGDLRGSNTLSECFNVDLGEASTSRYLKKKIWLSLVPLSLLSCIYFQHLISALKFSCSSSL
jgi:hypothetical protein